jgi:hypothetical protein
VADPQNLYDATLAAARYLCSGGLNLRDESQVLASILRYNNSMPYAQNVLGWAAAYATGVVPVDLPPLLGPAPPLGDAHLENAEGLGPNLPMNMHGLPSTDPLAQMPLIDLTGAPSNGPQPWSTQRPPGPSCTVICISGDPGGPQQAFNAPPTPAGMPPAPFGVPPAPFGVPPAPLPAAPPVPAPPAAPPAQVPPPAAPPVAPQPQPTVAPPAPAAPGGQPAAPQPAPPA